MFALALLLLMPDSPIVPGFALDPATQWAAIAACPVVFGFEAREIKGGSGVVVGVREGYAYVLTAAHVVPREGVEVRFYSQKSYPKHDWLAERPEVVKRWPQNDLALIRFPVGERQVPTLSLAAPGQRPKKYPAPTVTIGATDATQDKPPTIESDTIQAKRWVAHLGAPRQEQGYFWQTATRSRPGRSGGPLLDLQAHVIGICSADVDGRGFYVHLDEIQAALKQDGYSWLIPPRP